MGLKTRKTQANRRKGLLFAESSDMQQTASLLAAPDGGPSTQGTYVETHYAGVFRAMVAYCSGRQRRPRTYHRPKKMSSDTREALRA